MVAGALVIIGIVVTIIVVVVGTQHKNNTLTSSIGESSTIITTLISSTISSLSDSSTSINISSKSSSGFSTNTDSIITNCPPNNCTYSTWYTLTSSGYYGVEHVDINCTHVLSNLTAFIYVQRTVNATYANQYNTFWNNTVNQTYYYTNSQIIYSWSIISGQTISLDGYPYFIEAHFQLEGINQTVSQDTYTIITQSACNQQIIIHSGHF